MVKVGDWVRIKSGIFRGTLPLLGVVEEVSAREELRPYTVLVAFDEGDWACVFTEDEYEVIPDVVP